MDNTTRTLAEYVTRLRYDRLDPNTIREAKKRLIDSVGCALGGFDAEPATIARRLAAKTSGQPAARILGTGASTSMEMAAFTNSIMVRYLDFNDTYVSVGSGHPSDMIAACLAVAEALKADGKQTLLSIVAAYEVYTGLADQIALRGLGWDQGVFAVLGAAAGAGLLLGASVEQMGDALAIAITASVPTRQTRSGELAMWKGCATAAAVRAGVFAALLAKEGITGPTAAFEGRHGVWDQVTGKFALGPLGGGGGRPFGIERTNLKFFPSEYHSQAPTWMGLNLRKRVRIEDIAAINVQTYHICYSEIGSEPEKWEPKTRETADHSLPYLLSLALMDGAIRTDSFTAARMRDPATRALMKKITVAENADFERQFPNALMTEIEVLTRAGERLVERASYPRGHAKNPMSDEDIENKFKTLAENTMKPAQTDALLTALWEVEHAAEIGQVLALVQVAR